MDLHRVATALACLVVTACGTSDRTTLARTDTSASDSPVASGAAGPSSSSSDGPPPSPDSADGRPGGGWTTTVPAGLPLDAALPADGGDFKRGHAGAGLEFCGRPVTGPSPVEVRRASATGPEYGEGRELRLFRDDDGARRLLAAIDEAVAGCPAEEAGETTWHHDLRGSSLARDADAAYTVVRTYSDADDHPLLGATFWEVVRVGNAVLLTVTGGEYDPSGSLDPGIRDHAGDVAVIVESLCVFAAEPCDQGPRLGTSPHRTLVTAAGLGAIALGDPAEVVEASGGEVTDRTTGSGCRVVELWVNDGPDLGGNLDPDLGLATIHATTTAPARTDRGVGIGSSHAELVAAYPQGEGDAVLWSAPAAGYDDRHWRFWFDRDGRLEEFMLLLDEQRCGG